MNVKPPYLFYAYLLVSLLALLLTWLQIPPYLGLGLVAGNVQFWQDALIGNNPAGNFLTIDLLFLVLAVNIWMVVESRRLRMPWVWLYIGLGVFVGISFAFPLYLAMRERHGSTQGNGSAPGKGEPATIKAYDLIGLLFLGVTSLTISLWLTVG